VDLGAGRNRRIIYGSDITDRRTIEEDAAMADRCTTTGNDDVGFNSIQGSLALDVPQADGT